VRDERVAAGGDCGDGGEGSGAAPRRQHGHDGREWCLMPEIFCGGCNCHKCLIELADSANLNQALYRRRDTCKYFNYLKKYIKMLERNHCDLKY